MAVIYFRKDGWVKSVLGQAIAGASVYVCYQPADTAWVPPLPQIPLYSDVNGVGILAQPVITDGQGHYDYYAIAGLYTEVIVNGGKVQQVYKDQMVGTPVIAVNTPAIIASGFPGTFQVLQVPYSITSADITNGFASIPVAWPIIWPDNNYALTSGISSLLNVNKDFVVGVAHSITGSGFTLVVRLADAIPLIQGQSDLVASTNATNLISLTTALTALYQVTLYYGPSRTSALDTGKTWTPTIAWTDPSGNVLTASGTSPTVMLGPASGGNTGSYGVNWLQAYSIPMFVLGGTTIFVTGTYVGGAFPVNVSMRIVEMPNNSTIYTPGDTLIVNAVSIHN